MNPASSARTWIPKSTSGAHFAVQLRNLTSSRHLYFNSNALSSTVPLTLWSLKDLLILNQDSNSLRGSLLQQVGGMQLEECKFSYLWICQGTNFQVTFQSQQGLLQNLTDISESNNSFQGPIPGSFSDMVSLEFLDLSQNSFSGEIPKSLEKLPYLKYLNEKFQVEGHLVTSQLNFLCGMRHFVALLVPECSSDSHWRSRSKLILLSIPIFYGGFHSVSYKMSTKMQKRSRPRSPNTTSKNLDWNLCVQQMNFMRVICMVGEVLALYMKERFQMVQMLLFMFSICSYKERSEVSIQLRAALDIATLSKSSAGALILSSKPWSSTLKELCLESNSFTNDPSTQELSYVNSLTNYRELVALRVGHNPLYGMLPNSIVNLSSFLQAFRTCLSTQKMSQIKLRFKIKAIIT
ncbi:hypothetical protein SADUNF_Sadunf06G0020900 [Salix dunnii]|uniref:Uncharacterized protein n=1 Tax=Salix dunnii TaxID=1413687 RepID=A0A835K502_9ROSI|nr:hypothetical protein SADUNF_Sadunf06G0020900 [Salix dunnii]